MSLITTKPSLCTLDVEAPLMVVRVLRELEDAGILYCVLRGGDELLRQSDDEDEEVDLLINPQHLPSLTAVLHRFGFVQLRTWGHGPHHFFVAYNEAGDHWLKLDVVTKVAYGRPTHELSTRLADGCLNNRRRMGSIFLPAPEDELITLLLHCVVDKGSFPANWKYRITDLVEQVRNRNYLSQLLSEYWGSPLDFDALRRQVLDQEWDALLTSRASTTRRLVSRKPIAAFAQRLRDHFLRKLNHVARYLRPDALSVALLAPDGAGKSTLAESVCNRFYFPVDQIYMGLYQQREAATDRSIPGVGLSSNLLKQWTRYLQGYMKRARGRFVIFDRYTYDALLPSRKALSRLQRLRRWVLAYACPAPHLILMLDAPGDVLYARKHEHTAEYLEEHRQAYLKLQQRFPHMVVVDAAKDPDHVRRVVTSHIWRGYAERATAT